MAAEDAERVTAEIDLALDWKWSYADGDLGWWRSEHVGEFLLEWCPRKLSVFGAYAKSIPSSLASFVAFLAEYEDVAAVVDAVAAEFNGAVNVYGPSHGGRVAFGAVTLTANVHKLVLYEGWPVPDPEVYALPAGLEARMDALLAVGDRDGVVELLFRELENMSDEDRTGRGCPYHHPRDPRRAHRPSRPRAVPVVERSIWATARPRRRRPSALSAASAPSCLARA